VAHVPPMAATPEESTTEFLARHPDGHTEFLLERAKAGSDAAWNELYRRYRTRLVLEIQSRIPGFARRSFDANDVLQAAMGKAWEHIGGFEYRSEASLRRWLGTLVFNEFANLLKAQDLERANVRTESQGGNVDTAAREDDELRSERVLTEAELLERLGALELEDRDLVIMRHFEEMSFDDMARVLACSRTQAKKLYERALERLQRLLGP